MVGELKYGAKFEPSVIAEAVHHAHLLRRLRGGEAIHSILITQQNYWIRATVAELASTKRPMRPPRDRSGVPLWAERRGSRGRGDHPARGPGASWR